MNQQTTNTDPQVTVKTSARWTLNLRDLAKGAVMAAISAALASAYQLIDDGTIFTPQSAKVIGGATLLGLISYLLKNFATDTKIVEVKDK